MELCPPLHKGVCDFIFQKLDEYCADELAPLWFLVAQEHCQLASALSLPSASKAFRPCGDFYADNMFEGQKFIATKSFRKERIKGCIIPDIFSDI